MSIDIASAVASAKRRLHDLQTFQLPRLEKCSGPLGLHRELADELKGDMDGVRRNLELSRELAESEIERDRWVYQVDELDRELHDLRMAYREALVSSKRAIASRARSRRHELLMSRESGTGDTVDPSVDAQKAQARTGTSDDDALQTKTNEVTDALRRTTTLMQNELERSVLSVQMLDESTRTLQLTQALYDNYTSLLTTSAALVKAIERADWYDRLLIFSAFFLFLLVVGWVIKRRVLDKVVGGFGWWLVGSWKLVRLGLGRPVKKSAEVVTAAASAASTATALSSLSKLATAPSAAPVPPDKLDERADTGTGGIIDSVIPVDAPPSASAASVSNSAKSAAPTVRDEL